jgi:hypothetical protein
MTPLIILALVAYISILTHAVWSATEIVRWEYEHHRDEWQRDGYPAGLFWRAKECTVWSSNVAIWRLLFVWVFKTPEWASGSPECLRWFHRLRLAALVWILGLGCVMTPLLLFR